MLRFAAAAAFPLLLPFFFAVIPCEVVAVHSSGHIRRQIAESIHARIQKRFAPSVRGMFQPIQHPIDQPELKAFRLPWGKCLTNGVICQQLFSTFFTARESLRLPCTVSGVSTCILDGISAHFARLGGQLEGLSRFSGVRIRGFLAFPRLKYVRIFKQFLRINGIGRLGKNAFVPQLGLFI